MTKPPLARYHPGGCTNSGAGDKQSRHGTIRFRGVERHRLSSSSFSLFFASLFLLQPARAVQSGWSSRSNRNGRRVRQQSAKLAGGLLLRAAGCAWLGWSGSKEPNGALGDAGGGRESNLGDGWGSREPNGGEAERVRSYAWLGGERSKRGRLAAVRS